MFLDNNQINEIKGLENLKKIVKISLNINRISEIKNLEGLESLEFFQIESNPLTDLSPSQARLISKSITAVKRLCRAKFVHFRGERINIQDQVLDLSSRGILDISEIEGLDKIFNLKRLDLSQN